MLTLSVNFVTDPSRALPPVLSSPNAAAQAAAGGVRTAVQENFLRLGGRKFWQRAAELTRVEPTGRGKAEVSVYRRGVALRLFGGLVFARPGHAMALPVRTNNRTDLWPREMPGLEGTIKDLSSTQRLKVSIDTNVDMARGWMQRCRSMANTTRPAQELYRAWPARQERNWPARWKEAAEAIGWEGVATNGQMIALKTSPIWVALSRFGQPYPPFDYGSHMRVRSVSLETAQDAGLLTTEEEYQDARESMEEESRRSLNENVEVNVQGWSYALLEEIQKQLKGLAVLDHGVLRMTDPNGTTPYSPEKLARIISDPLPNGIPNLQLKALRDWMEDSSRFNGNRPEVGLNEKEDLARLIARCKSEPSTQILVRGMTKPSQLKLQKFLDDIRQKGYYQANEGKLADSWSMSDRTAERYARGSDWQIKLVCTSHKSAKDLRPLYRVAQPQSKTPTLPLSTEAELLIPGNVRLNVTKITEEPLARGKRVTIICKEEE